MTFFYSCWNQNKLHNLVMIQVLFFTLIRKQLSFSSKLFVLYFYLQFFLSLIRYSVKKIVVSEFVMVNKINTNHS